MKFKTATRDNLTSLAMVVVGVLFASGIMVHSARDVGAHNENWRECVNQIAREAYVEDDVDDTFDSGFDAGLYASKICGVMK